MFIIWGWLVWEKDDQESLYLSLQLPQRRGCQSLTPGNKLQNEGKWTQLLPGKIRLDIRKKRIGKGLKALDRVALESGRVTIPGKCQYNMDIALEDPV